MTVNVQNKNGIRYGNFDINGIKGYFPRQAITSTNLNHVKDAGKSNFDFKTNILEIVEFYPDRLIAEPEYKEKRIKTISKIIQNNADKLCLFTLKGVRDDFKITKHRNEFLIKFQIKCGFKLIKAFFRHVRNALENSTYYRNMIPKGSSFVSALDENLPHFTFRSLYLDCYEKGDEIISFLGREPSKQNSKNLKNKLNFQFILRRKDDKIIRLTSFTRKSIDGFASSYVYNLFGLDVYSFMTRLGDQDIPEIKLKALNGFKYEILSENTTLICVLTGMNLYHFSKKFESEIEKSSLPVSVHAIATLNNEFEILHEKYTREQLEKIIGNRFYRLES